MKTLTKTLCGLAIILAIACKKEDTPGPKGIGSLGTPGTGVPGAAANADINVIIQNNGSDSSSGIDIFYSDWYSPGHASSPNPGNGGTSGNGNPNPIPNPNSGIFPQSHSFSVTAPIITKDILEKGIVLAYCRLHDEGEYTRPLATTKIVDNYMHMFNFGMTVGKIHFTLYVTNPAGVRGMDSRDKFRYVVIPSTKPLRLKKPLTQMSYEEICDMFGIPK